MRKHMTARFDDSTRHGRRWIANAIRDSRALRRGVQSPSVFGVSLKLAGTPVPPDVFEPRISQARGLCVHKMVAALLSARRCDRHRDYIANVSATKGWPRIPGCEQREGGGRHAALRPPVQGALCRHRHRTSGYRYVRTACDHANTPGTSTRRGFGEIEERSNGNQPPQPHVSGRNAEKNGGMHAVS